MEWKNILKAPFNMGREATNFRDGQAMNKQKLIDNIEPLAEKYLDRMIKEEMTRLLSTGKTNLVRFKGKDPVLKFMSQLQGLTNEEVAQKLKELYGAEIVELSGDVNGPIGGFELMIQFAPSGTVY